ncbi:MAG: 6-phosphogluconolactonase [Betaproteobacteria bacterium]|nr:6-phosphogluconolactonase [Betaproteobacteria bacterium]MDE2310155.1 6-phosphogluconolactonase [Betaproteobacteria bacterium]
MPLLKNSDPPQQCRWHGYHTTAELEQAAAQAILRAAQQAISQRGAFYIVLAGGTSPRRVYELLSKADTDWSAWHVYFGDERCLPPDHAERNSRMAALAWLDHVAIPPDQIHPIPAETGAEAAAQAYARIVEGIKIFDLVLLGLGEDGHTASLFPDHDWGNTPDAPAAITVFDSPKPPPQRVSLSAHRLRAAHQVMFLVTGVAKQQAVTGWRKGVRIPAAAITPANGVDVYIEAALLKS